MLGSGDSLPVLVQVTKDTSHAHLLTVCVYMFLCRFLHAQASGINCSLLGSAPTNTAHAQNLLRLSQKYVKKLAS